MTSCFGGTKPILGRKRITLPEPKSYILTLPHPQGHEMSVKCEQSIDELTVQVWLLYHHPNFKYFTLCVSGTELRTDKQTDGRTDGQTDGRTDRRSNY